MSDPTTEDVSSGHDQAPQASQASQASLEGASVDGRWRYRTGEAPGEVVFWNDGGPEQSLVLTGGPVIEVRVLEKAGEVLVRTERFEHTLCRDTSGQGWRVIMTRREE
jgi:hypothetical protein